MTFAPTFREGAGWLRLGGLGARYEARAEVTFAHPALVRFAIDYAPRAGESGPRFRQEAIVLPDHALFTTRKISDDGTPWGLTWPVLENDGAPLVTARSARAATTAYRAGGDEQAFVSLDARASLDASEPPVRSTYGDLRPVRVTTPGAAQVTLVYPRSPGDPPAEAVRASFRRTPRGFRSRLGRLEGDVFVGRGYAGGEASAVDLDGDGRPDLRFDARCRFLLRRDGAADTLEVDRPVTATLRGRTLALRPHSPARVD